MTSASIQWRTVAAKAGRGWVEAPSRDGRKSITLSPRILSRSLLIDTKETQITQIMDTKMQGHTLRA